MIVVTGGLEDTSCKKIYDITSDQYYHVGQIPPYDVGKKKKWYGWKQRPHQRSLNLMIRVLGDRLIEDRVDKIKNICKVYWVMYSSKVAEL